MERRDGKTEVLPKLQVKAVVQNTLQFTKEHLYEKGSDSGKHKQDVPFSALRNYWESEAFFRLLSVYSKRLDLKLVKVQTVSFNLRVFSSILVELFRNYSTFCT